MWSFLLRRLAQGLVIVFVVASLTFVLIHLAPGEPFAGLLMDPRVTPALRAAFRAHYGLDQPVVVQYGHYLLNLARGDLGLSFSFQRPVLAVVAGALPGTLLLMGTALVLGFAGGIALGAAQAAGRGGWFDRLTSWVTIVVAALPDFWLATALVVLFALRWHALPASGMTDPAMHRFYSTGGRVLDVARHLVLPASTLALIVGAVVARYQRAAMLETLPEEFIRAARAKGLPRSTVVYRHALANALLPTITLLGLAFPALLGGAVFVETVFGWPGMGFLAVDALGARDYPLVLATAIVGSVMVVLGGLIADVLYAAADPRLRRA